MSYVRVWVLLLGTLVYANPALSFFNFEGGLGQRSVDPKVDIKGLKSGKSTKGVLVRASFHLDPIPLIPLSFGLGLEQLNANGSLSPKKSKGSSLDIVPEIQAWLPLPVIPFVRLGYALGKVDGGELTSYGIRAGLGLRYGLIPTLAVYGEYLTGRDRAKKDDLNWESEHHSVILGLQWGI